VEPYRVKLDVYNGPLDLLLYLIRRDEVDIYDIPIAHVTEQYCRYVELLKELDPDLVGDFLVMAATLLELKSRMLLPTPPPEEGGAEQGLGDPRAELVRQLLQYKAFKDAAEQLRLSAAQQALRHPRSPVRPEFGERKLDLEEVQIWHLLEAFSSLMSSIGKGPRAWCTMTRPSRCTPRTSWTGWRAMAT
jgi:segregation and condensation protein A